MQIEVHKTVAARPPAVFKIVADTMNWPQIIGSVTAIELLTCGRVRVGTRVRLTRIMHGHQIDRRVGGRNVGAAAPAAVARRR